MIDVHDAAVNTGPKDLSGAEPSLCVSGDSQVALSGPQELCCWNVMPKGKASFHATCDG